MIQKHWQAFTKPRLHWKPYGYSIHGNARFRDETRHVRVFHEAWSYLEQFLWFRITVVVLGAVSMTALVFGVLYWIATHVRVTIV